MIDWEKQWELHAPNYRNGRLELSLSSYGGTGTLHLYPGPGFGDFSHPTTRLTALLMAPRVNERVVVDIGCGSGILTLLALKLGAKSAIGIDCEEEAVSHAIENSARTGARASFYLPKEAPLPERSCILMNMIASQQESAIAQYAPLFVKPFYIMTSGILQEEEADYLSKTERWGWKLVEKKSLDGWMGYIFIKKAG